MNERKLRGDWGEALTAAYLRRKKYTIVASKFRCRMGEIDLIAKKDGILCFGSQDPFRDTARSPKGVCRTAEKRTHPSGGGDLYFTL